MPVLTQQPPPTPMPGDQYDPAVVGAICRAVLETQGVVQQIVDLLAPFSPSQTPVTDTVNGLSYYCLAYLAGNAPTVTANLNPYAGSDESDGSTAQVSIQYGTHNDTPATIGGTPLSTDPSDNILEVSGSGIVYAQVDFTYDTSGTITIVDNLINYSGSSTPPDDSISPAGDGSGSGTLYQTLFAFSVSYDGDGNAVVTIAQNVGGSQRFGICQGTGANADGDTTDSISGPWGV